MTRLAVAGVAAAACVGAAALAQIAPGPARPVIVRLPERPAPVGAPRPARKPLSLHCTLMRRDGSQFVASMRVLFDGGATKQNGGVSLAMDSAAPDLPRGIFTGAIAGLPLMDREIFELGASSGSPVQRREFELDNDMSFAGDGRLIALGYRATLFRLIEDLRSSAAVGYCRPA